MSDQLYATRLRWSHGCGVAKLYGVSVPITGAPVIGGNAVHLLDYIPEIRLRQIQHRSVDRVTDMTDDEVRAADALLRALHHPKE